MCTRCDPPPLTHKEHWRCQVLHNEGPLRCWCPSTPRTQRVHRRTCTSVSLSQHEVLRWKMRSTKRPRRQPVTRRPAGPGRDVCFLTSTRHERLRTREEETASAHRRQGSEHVHTHGDRARTEHGTYSLSGVFTYNQAKSSRLHHRLSQERFGERSQNNPRLKKRGKLWKF